MHFVTFYSLVLVPAALGLATPDAFSYKQHVQAKQAATARALDTSRLHLHVLFVDTDNNAKARIARGLMNRIDCRI